MVVDTSALVAIFREESDAEQLLARLRPRAMIGAPNLLEFYMVAAGRQGMQAAAEARAFVERLDLSVVSFDEEMSAMAFEAFLRFGKGRSHPARLNYGDCMTYALAKVVDAPLLYKGGDFSKTDIRTIG